jgi:hypothetical protein
MRENIPALDVVRKAAMLSRGPKKRSGVEPVVLFVDIADHQAAMCADQICRMPKTVRLSERYVVVVDRNDDVGAPTQGVEKRDIPALN